MTTNYLKDIKVMSSFKQMINALSILINVLRFAAVGFLILQTVFMMRDKT